MCNKNNLNQNIINTGRSCKKCVFLNFTLHSAFLKDGIYHHHYFEVWPLLACPLEKTHEAHRNNKKCAIYAVETKKEKVCLFM